MHNRLLDSVILIDHFNNVTKSTEFLMGLHPERTAISVVTRAEILVGVEENVKDKVIAFLDQYAVLPIDKNIADLAAELRKKHRWKLPDAFQAALAVHHNLKLCTRNSKDFNPKDYPFVEIPYQL